MSIVPRDVSTRARAGQLPARAHVDRGPVDRPALPAADDHHHGRAATRATCSRSTACRCTRGSARCRSTRARRPAPSARSSCSRSAATTSSRSVLRSARLGRVSAVPAGQHLRPPRRQLRRGVGAAVAAGAGARRRRGLRSAGAARRLRLDRARLRVHRRQARGLRGAAGGQACRRATSTSRSAACSTTRGIDESVAPDDSGHQYLQRYSLSHFDRHMDDFGIDRERAGAGVGRERACRAARGGTAVVERRAARRARCSVRAASALRTLRLVDAATTGPLRRGRRGAVPPPDTDEDARCARALRYDAGPPPADPSNRFADDPAARALRPAAVLRPVALGPAARRRQRRQPAARSASRAKRARELRGLPRAADAASSTRAARTGRSRSARSGPRAARPPCSRSRSRRSTTGTAAATRSGARRSA